MSSELAKSDCSILNSPEADAARARIAVWVHAFYANLNYWAERGYVDQTITDYDRVGPDWPDDSKDDYGPVTPAVRR